MERDADRHKRAGKALSAGRHDSDRCWSPARPTGTAGTWMKGLPHLRFIGASHEESLATCDNMKMRHLARSEWYQRLWPTPFMGDQNQGPTS